jgi:hypothetical protein
MSILDYGSPALQSFWDNEDPMADLQVDVLRFPVHFEVTERACCTFCADDSAVLSTSGNCRYCDSAAAQYDYERGYSIELLYG